jgi:hypothetical protein
MEKWEYMTEFVYASIEISGVREFMRQRWPNWQNPPKFTPETMILRLNKLGTEGWELMHVEPVAKVGNNGDVGFVTGEGATYWSNAYFCVFKRRME